MTATIYNGYPHSIGFQSTHETEDGDVVAEKVWLEPGEVKELDDEVFEGLEDDDRFRRCVDVGEIEVDPPTDDKRLRDLRESLLYESMNEKFIKRLSAKATDIETVGQEEVQRAQAALGG